MTNTKRLALFTALFLSNMAGLLVLPKPCFAKARADIVRINFTWDENYLYAAFDVNDPDIQGTSKAPNEPVGDDDAVALYLQSDRQKNETIGPNSYRMIVSAAGGSEFAYGENGKWVKKDIFTFKYAVKLDGSINQNQDDDTGYAIEIALPWAEVGLKGTIGTSFLFNAIVQMKGEHTGFLSLVKGVVTEADRDNPSKWEELWLRGAVQPVIVRSPGRIMINRSLQRKPVVDGRMLASEYNERTAFELQKPPVEKAVHILRDFPVENLIFASYYYDFDGSENQAEFVNKPYGGFGPWFAGNRIEFHRNMLKDARRAGIDVMLAVNDIAPKASNRSSTLALVGALKEMAAAREDFPLVALMLDASTAASADQQAIWSAISNFYNLIPPEYRTTVRLPESRGGQAAFPVFVKGDFGLAGEAREWLDAQAEKSYGQKLLIVADDGAGRQADGFVPGFSADAGWGYNDKGWVKIGRLTPGFVRGGKALGRNAGATYQAGWDAVIEKNPDWVLIDSFNCWRDGSEIATSGEYGLLYIDQTTLQTSRFNGRKEWSAKYLSSTIAPVATADGITVAQVDVRNVGTRAWNAAEQIRFGYRWYQGGRLYSQGLVSVPIQRNVGINEMIKLNVGVAAVDKDKDPLPAGDWTIVFDMISPDGITFSARGDRPLAVPIKVGEVATKACTVLASTIPVGMAPGAAYLASVFVRNDGNSTWTRGGMVSLRLQARQGVQPEKAKAITSWKAVLPDDVLAGGITEIPVVLDLRKLPALTSSEMPLWIEAEMQDGAVAIPATSGKPATFATTLGSSDTGVRLKPPDTLIPQQVFGTPMKFQIGVFNNGAHDWTSDTRLVASWYSLDGKLLIKNGGEGRVKKKLKPGEQVAVPVELISPSYAGQYVVRWKLALNSSEDETDLYGGSSTSVVTQYVTVAGPTVVPQDLTALFDSDVFTSETQPDGSLDGKSGLPAASIPPLVAPTNSPSRLYPVGLYGADPAGGVTNADATTWRWISFMWPDKSDEKKNAITAGGQTLTVNTDGIVRAHLLCTSSGGAKSAEFVLNFQSGQQKITTAVGDWNTPSATDIVAYQTAYRANGTEVEPKPAYLYDVVLKADPGRTLSSIVLPNDASIKVLALSLEKATPARAGAH